MAETHPVNADRHDERESGSSDAANAPEERSPESSGRGRHLVVRAWRGLIEATPSILVFGLLAAIGYWGHENEWKIPAFSELTGAAKPAAQAWCAEHGVPEEICIACNPDLMPKGELYGWCSEHGVAECVLDHPQLAQLNGAPSVTPEDLQRARRALELKERPKNDPMCKMHLRRIQFVSREAVDQAGIDIGLVERGPIVETIAANGEVRFDPTLVTRLSSRAPGTVWRVDKNVGDAVCEGDLLALVDAARVGQAKAELLDAKAQLQLQEQNVERLSSLGDIIAGKRLQEAEAARAQAEAALRKAAQTLVNLGLPITAAEVRGKSAGEVEKQLRFLGLPEAAAEQLDAEQLDASQTTANLIPILSPRDGVIVTRDVVAGEVVDSAKTLFTVVDSRRMWLLLDVPLEDAKYVKMGQRLVFRPGGDGREHGGEITWISPRIEHQTRTVKVRAVLSNDDGKLYDEEFGAAHIVLREEHSAIIAPEEAIHWEGCCHVAFVRDKDYFKDDSYKVFHTRMVRPGVANDGHTELIAGLLPGEVVVTKGSGVLRAELLKGNLGAG